MTNEKELKQQVSEAILACQDKQAEDVAVLELEKDSGAFTDYFVMCSGANQRQVQAIADAVEERIEKLGMRVTHSEGYKQAEWVLLDYVDFVVHIFSEKARQFYDLERLWKSAKRIEPSELLPKPKAPRAASAKTASAKVVKAKPAKAKPASKSASSTSQKVSKKKA
jgi:ribosome-associated protein